MQLSSRTFNTGSSLHNHTRAIKRGTNTTLEIVVKSIVLCDENHCSIRLCSFVKFIIAHLTVVCLGIVSAVRRCLMQKALTVSVEEFALLLARIKQQSASIVELVLGVFGGKLHADGNVCMNH